MTLPVPAAEPPQRLLLPDVRRLDQMPSLPAWVASRIASLESEVQPDPTSRKWRKVSTLPAKMALTMAERNELASHASDLRALCDRTPITDPDAMQETLRAVTQMMLVLPSTTQTELSAEVRGEAFIDAVDDLPPWAVRAAIRRWNRGDCDLNQQGKAYDYHWCPAPAELRRIAWTQMYRVRFRANEIERLLAAQPPLEFSDEHCTQMRDRLVKLFRGVGVPAGRQDGSGGVSGGQPDGGAHCGTRPKAQPGLKREGGRRRRGDRRK